MGGPSEVRAAGGVLWRPTAAGDVEVLVVHRPRYDDWSFPKGKCDGDETFARTAQREVLEETAIAVAFGPELGEVRYTDGKGRPKVVRYWAMTPVAGRFEANDEVDRAEWLGSEEARGRLTYAHDATVLDRLLAAI